MAKTITQVGFLLASIVVVLLFLTAKTYNQLVISTLLYIPLAFIALKIFKRSDEDSPLLSVQVSASDTNENHVATSQKKIDKVDIADVDKRAFLKIIGAAGLSFFVFSLFNKKLNSPLIGGPSTPTTTALEDSSGKKIDPVEKQPTDGYKICEIDDDIVAYYGFTNKDGAWLIMREDTDNNSFRYSKGDNDFPGNWDKRKQLGYDYFHNVF